ncbi:unnamed protein product, partial [Prorocentrum cordatum]
LFRARAARRQAESRASPLAAQSLPTMGSSPLVLALGLLPALASGHAFLTKPEMRGGAYENVGNGYCPQCLGSTDLPMATCGNAHFLDAVGPVTELRAGELAEFVITVTAHHKGHFVFRLCGQRLDSQAGDYQAQEECLNEHVLSRARPEEVHVDCQKDDPRGDCQPYDEANPGHWYLPPHNGSHLTRTQHRFHYWIPADLTCESCTLQWWWMSANSCTPHPDAYRCYFKEMERQGWDARAWCDGVVCSYQGECPAEQGGSVLCGEQFKNCADVRVVEGGGASAGPTPAPSPTEPPETPEPEPAPEPEGSKQLVAFVENWLPCPSLDKVRGYDKVIVSFAVSYTWNPTKNQCDQSCTIGMPATCDNQAKPDLIEAWRQAGTKVLLSFGGAGMGGSWAGDVNDCWEYCFGRVDSVVSRLVEIVDSQGFDGVDIRLPEYDHSDTSRGRLQRRLPLASVLQRPVQARDRHPARHRAHGTPRGRHLRRRRQQSGVWLLHLRLLWDRQQCERRPGRLHPPGRRRGLPWARRGLPVGRLRRRWLVRAGEAGACLRAQRDAVARAFGADAGAHGGAHDAVAHAGGADAGAHGGARDPVAHAGGADADASANGVARDLPHRFRRGAQRLRGGCGPPRQGLGLRWALYRVPGWEQRLLRRP